MDCDMCGKTATAKAKIEGAEMAVCDSCAKHGANVRPLQAATTVKRPRSPFSQAPREELIEQIRPDIAKLLREHRERLKLNQEQFAAKLQLRASTYNHYESGAAVPDIATARKLEQTLKIPLVVHMKVTSGPMTQHDEAKELTLGDFIKRRR